MTTATAIDVSFDRVAAMLRTAAASSGVDGREARSKAREAVAVYNGLAAQRRGAARRIAKVEFLRPLPLIGTAVLSPLEFDLREIAQTAAGARSKAERLLKRVEDAARAARTIRSLSTRVGEAQAASRSLGPPPGFVLKIFEPLGSRIHAISRRSDSRQTADVVQAALDIVAFVEHWAADAANRARAVPQEAPSNVGARRLLTIPSERIWLPIPWNRRREALALGAKADMNAGKGSDVFVLPDQDLRPFQSMLPLVRRIRRTAPIAFPPIAAKAAGQNLWSLFDRSTWDHVRTTNYGRTGHRCMLCGEQNPRAATEAGRSRGPVDAHEVWSWSMPDDDPSLGVGIQRLERIMVLCPSCHACFHAGHATTLARQDARYEEAAAFIRSRQGDITGLEGVALDEHLARSAEAWERTRGVDRWVLDLSHLAAQDYMADIEPVFIAGNNAGFAPEDVAGMAFATDDGRRFDAREPAALLASLLEDRPPLRLAWSRP